MADVSVRMGVSGIAQFKQGLKQAQDSVKTIDAALKKNEAQFKATGNAQDYMGQKTDLLKQKLVSQKQAAANASQALAQMVKDGVDPASSSYQKLAQSLLDAETAAIETETQLNSLGTASTDAAKQTDNLENSLQGLNKKVSLQQVITGINSITSGMEKAAKKAVELGKSIWDNIMDSAAYADDTATLAARMGLTTEEVQQMQYVANRFEAPVETIAKAWKKVKMSMSSDSDEIMEDFKKLGIAAETVVDDSFGQQRQTVMLYSDYKDVFWATGEAIMKLRNEEDQERMAQKLLGRSWDELIPLFTAGRKAYEEALDAAPTNSEEAINNAAELNAKVEELEQSFRVLKTEVIGDIAPALTGAAETLEKLITSITDYLRTDEGQEMLEKLGKAVEGLFSDLSKIDPQQVVAGFTSVFEGLIGGLQWLVDNSGTVITAMEFILGGWATLKLTGGALQVLNLINGLKGMGGASGVNKAIEKIANNGAEKVAEADAGAKAANTAGKSSVLGWITEGLGISGWGVLGGTSLIAAGTYAISELVNYVNGIAQKAREVEADANRYSDFTEGAQENYAWGGLDNRAVLETYVNALMKTTGGTTGINGPGSILERMATSLGSELISAFDYTNTSGEGRNKLIDMLDMDDQNAAVAAMMLKAAGVKTSDVDYSAQYAKYEELLRSGGLGYEWALGTMTDFFNKSGVWANGRWGIPGFENTSGTMPVINGMPLANMSGYVMTSDQNKKQYEGTWDPEGLETQTQTLESDLSGVNEKLPVTTESVEALGEEADEAKDHVSKMGELAGGAEGEVQDLGEAAGGAAEALRSIQVPDLSSWIFGSHANGIPYVPFDGYGAILHKGERVVPAREASGSRSYNSNLYIESMYMNNGTDAEGLAAAMAAAQRRTMSGYGS